MRTMHGQIEGLINPGVDKLPQWLTDATASAHMKDIKAIASGTVPDENGNEGVALMLVFKDQSVVLTAMSNEMARELIYAILDVVE